MPLVQQCAFVQVYLEVAYCAKAHLEHWYANLFVYIPSSPQIIAHTMLDQLESLDKECCFNCVGLIS